VSAPALANVRLDCAGVRSRLHRGARHPGESVPVTSWLKDVRAELAQIIYEQPVYPKNRYLDKVPGKHADYKREVIDKQVALLQKRGIWKKPAHSPG
jgi:beta-ureidopropionase